MYELAAVGQKNPHIEALRLIAALSVVCVHIPLIGAGDFGVDIFFTISGLVMMQSTEKGSEKFFLKRLIRILPTYYLFTFGVFGLALVMPWVLDNTTANLEHLAKSLLFIPFDKNGIGHSPILFLGWTLDFEMYFYLLFAVALFVNHRFRGEIVSAFLIIVLFLSKQGHGLPFEVYSDSIVAEFILGIALFELITRRRVTVLLVLGGLYLLPLLSGDTGLTGRGYAIGFPAFLFCLLALSLSSYYAIPKPIAFLGSASYALYLTHPYVIQVFEKIAGWFDASLGLALAATALSFVLTLTVAALIYTYLEAPVQRYLRSKLV